MLGQAVIAQGRASHKATGGQPAWEAGGGCSQPASLQGITGLASLWEDPALPAMLGRGRPGVHPTWPSRLIA